MRRYSSFHYVPLLLVLLCGADWPEFRGPTGQGHSDATDLPSQWSETDNIAWKAPLPGLGWSSPVVQGERLWLTTATDEGRSLRLLCLNASSGELLYDVEVIGQGTPESVHQKNSFASPTPLLEDDRVYVHFGAFGTACLSTDGELVWKTRIDYDHRHGPGGSPVLYDDLLIFSCDGFTQQSVVALDKHTGEQRWRVERPSQHAYCTPLVVHVDGQDQVISPGAEAAMAYDPRTGEEIWRCRYDGYSLIPRPVTGHGLVFICTGYNTPQIYAVRLGGSGDITDTHVAWTMKRGAPHSPSLLLVGDELYAVSDNGIGSCVDARTGDVHWQERIGGNFSASPLLADGKIYLLDEAGTCTVIKPGKEYEELARNSIEGRTLASITPLDHALLLRSDTHLYRIEQ